MEVRTISPYMYHQQDVLCEKNLTYHDFKQSQKRNSQLDLVQDITGDIFTNLYLLTGKGPSSNQYSHVPSSPLYSHSFDEDNILDQLPPPPNPTHIRGTIHQVVEVIKKIFYASEDTLLDATQTPKSLVEMEQETKGAYFIWDRGLKTLYSGSVSKEITDVFDQAIDLIKLRINKNRKMQENRFVFVFLVSLSVVFSLLGRTKLASFGLAISALSFIYMLSYYITSSFKQAQMESELQISLDAIYAKI